MAVIEHVIRVRDEASKALGDTAEAAEGVQEEVAEADLAMSGLVSTAGAMATAALALGAAVGQLAQSVADSKNQISDASVRTGIATDTLAGLRLAAEGSGLQFSSLERGLNTFAQRLSDASQGTGEAIDGLRRLGFTQEEIIALSSDTDAAFKAISERIGNVGTTAEQSAVLADVFGGSVGPKLAQAFGGSFGSLEAFVEQARAAGVNMDTAAESAGRWQRSMAELDTAVEGATDRLLSAFGGEGGVAGLVEDFTLGLTFASTFISVRIQEMLEGIGLLSTALKQFFAFEFEAAATSAAEGLGKFTGFTTEAVDEAVDAAKALVAAREGLSAAFAGGAGGSAGIPGSRGTEIPPDATTTAGVAGTSGDIQKLLDGIGQAFGELTSIGADEQVRLLSSMLASIEGQPTTEQLADVLDKANEELAFQLQDPFPSGEEVADALSTRPLRFDPASIAGAFQGLGDPIASALTGDLTGILSGVAGLTADPVVGGALQGIATGISLLETIGRRGPEFIVEEIQNTTDAIIAGIEALDELLPELAVAFAEAIPAIIEALIENLGPIIMALSEAMTTLLVQLPFGIAAAILSALGFEGAADRVSGAGKSITEALVVDSDGSGRTGAIGSLLGLDPGQSGRGGIRITLNGVIASDEDSLIERLSGALERGNVLGRRA